MADAAMTVLLETLSHMLLSCSDLISGAEDQLRLLGIEVESFRAFLRDSANKPKEEEPWREMEREIEKVVYEAQDTIDSYSIDRSGAQSKIDRFRRHRQVILRSLAADVRPFREYNVKPLLEKARIEFPNMLLVEELQQIIAEELKAAPAVVLLDGISELLTILGGDLNSSAEEDLRLLKNEVELLGFFAYYANTDDDMELFRKMEKEIKRCFFRAQDMLGPYLRHAAVVHKNIDLVLQRRDLYSKPSSSLAEVVRSFREDKVKPMLEKARINFADVILIGDGSETSLEEAHQIIKVNKDWSIGQDGGVGLEHEQLIITRFLKEATEELDFISIIGFPGLGKTTLARKVYQSQLIQYGYPTRIWVTVSQNVNIKDVFLDILKEVTSKDMSSMKSDELALLVHQFLEKRKFFLVLDDVWSPADFYGICEALPKSNRSSKVLITSRSWDVGACAKRSVGAHSMRYLRKDECWELLQLQVFGGLSICPPELIQIGRQIATNCDGVPLVIVIIGGVLAEQLTMKQSISALEKAWIKVSRYMSEYIYYERDLIIKAIGLGYSTLPDELRNLFLYLGVFPEDYEIPATPLTRLWIAEGFIQHQEGRSLEDIAEENLTRLIQMKLVIVDKVRSNGKVKSCRLHDKVRDFCIQKGMKINLFQKIDSPKAEKALLEQEKLCRLSIHSDLLNFFSSKPYFPRVRSFSCYYKTESLLPPEDTSKIPGDSFELLRVLDIKHIRFTRFPLELTQLFCLRYVVLSSHFKILPEVFSKLWNIQTLTIHTSSRTLEIKADIWKMIGLRHLQTYASIILRMEPENHSDQELQTLTNLSPDNCTTNMFNRARCLKKLGIRGMLPILLDGEAGSRKFDHFEKLKNLENLKLLNDVHMSSPSECLLSCLPPPNKFPSKLKSLTLSATFLSWEHMSVLGMLANLEVLKLKDNAFKGECWEVADGSFLSLQVLQIGYTNLVSWKVARGHFPRLRSLALRNCEKLDTLPRQLQYVLSLQEIELLRPSKALTASTQNFWEERERFREGRYRIKLSIYFPADD